MNEQRFELTVQITETQAHHAAQFLKRAGWTEYRACAVDNEEAYAIRDALDAIQRALRDAGFAPR